MIEVGRVCVKLAGRDAGKKAIIVEKIDNNYVLIDGQTRRRKCNVSHLEPLKTLLKIKKGASHNEVVREFKTLGMEIIETKPKKSTAKPLKKRKSQEKSKKEIKTEEEKKTKTIKKKTPTKKSAKNVKKKST
tara:strand:+ start:5440 stop:5835 length:396 start_codon:yes stop_codon:yes gene_type:complete